MVFYDPIGWSYSAVGTWPRLLFLVVGHAALTLGVVHYVGQDGLRSQLIWVSFLTWFQFLSLYALRRVLLATMPRAS